jgi:predicted dehydrogenase
MKIGILSFAHLHAEAYINNLRAIPDVEMIGLADEDAARGRHFAELFNARYFESYAQLLAEKPDGPLVELAAQAGVNILCEKPIATTLEDGRAMLEACRKAGVMLMIAFPMRFSASLLEVKARLDAGDLGRVYCFNGTNQGELPRKGRDWFTDKELAGGGAVMDHTVHLADIFRWYTGSQVREVYAQTNHIFYAGEVDVETGGLIMLTLENGVFASIDTSWSRPPYWPSWGGLTFEMVTERGAVLVDAFKQNLTVFSAGLQRPEWAFWGSDANQAMLNEFAAAIRERRQPAVTGEDGYRALQVALAAYESARTGQPVRLE